MNVERVLGVPPRDSNPKQRQSGAGLGAQRDAILKEAELRGVDRVRQDVDRRGQKTLGGRDLNDDAAIAGTLERVQPVPVARQRRNSKRSTSISDPSASRISAGYPNPAPQPASTSEPRTRPTSQRPGRSLSWPWFGRPGPKVPYVARRMSGSRVTLWPVVVKRRSVAQGSSRWRAAMTSRLL
jgi:hypothetical protein